MKSEVRLIDANAATLSTYNNPYWTESEAAGVRSFLLHQPTIDPETLGPTGRWVKDKDGDEYCENCSRYMPVREITGDPSAHKYCPSCGAKMEG